HDEPGDRVERHAPSPQRRVQHEQQRARVTPRPREALLHRVGGVASYRHRRAVGVAGQARALVLAVSDALRGEVYAGAFRFGSRAVVTELEPGVRRPDALVALGLRPDVLVGEAPADVREVLERATGRTMIGPPEGAPGATALIALAAMEGGTREVVDPSEWEPFYGRPAEAQARWEITHGRPLPDPAGGAR
ncbi:MAG TPA: hypothetical protein VFR62_13585, partial [Gemmatimonadales bacterium]|nr:hypothetical protein [Gemmatimonadales bacterium]